MIRWLTDWWRGYTDADVAQLRRRLKQNPDAQLSEREWTAYVDNEMWRTH